MMRTNTIENTNENFQIEIMLLKQVVEQLQSENQLLKELIRLGTHKRFGSSSEKSLVLNQLSLFSDNEKEPDNKPLEKPITQEITYTRRKATKKDKFEDLPVETIEYRLPIKEQICDCCFGKLHEMSKEVRREVEIVPAKVKIVEHVSYLYSCRTCEKENISVPIKKAQAPKPALPGSPASSSAIAYVMSQKFVESMPLYRLEKHFERMNVKFSRQTMSNWMINACEKWLKIIYERMKKELLNQNIIHCDETSLQVLKEPGKTAESKSYMWLYRSGRYEKPVVLYDYKPTRSGECPKNFLEGFSGHAHVDGYGGYNKVKEVRLVACWAHARRSFVDALKALPKNVKTKNQSSIISNKGLDYCNRLFEIERTLKEETPEVRFIERLKRSKPILDDFKKWLDYYLPRTLPSSKTGKAIRYCLNIWDKLYVFLENGKLEIDNNRAERSIKPFVIARKNFLFCNTQRGANAAAIIFSIVESAKESGLNPFEYLKYLFDVMPNFFDLNEETLDTLVPWAQELPDYCRVKK